MKKLAILSLTFLLAMAVVRIQAQDAQKGKAAIKETKKEVKTEKKELKSERKELRKLEATNVNVASKNSFFERFGDVPDVKWKSSVYFDEATFTKGGHEMTAFFDFYGKLVGTTELETFADVPAIGQKTIKKEYKDYYVGPVVFYDDNEFSDTDMLLYGVQFDDEDNYFVELAKGNKKVMVRVNTSGNVFYFKDL
jgi:hypothetical protein